MFVELYQKTKDVCKVYYKNRCGECPLRSLCVTEKVLLIKEKMNDHTTRLNTLAEGVEL